jgi:hypothetical protein
MTDIDIRPLAVDKTLQVLASHPLEQDSSHPELGHGGNVLPKAPKDPKNLQPGAHHKQNCVDKDVTAVAADKLFRFSKTAYFHPESKPSDYISQILTDPYFKQVHKTGI